MTEGASAGSVSGRELAWMWHAVRRHIVMIIVLVLAATIVMAAMVVMRTKEYTAYVEVLIEAGESKFSDLQETKSYVAEEVTPADMESELKLIGSSRVIGRVVDEFHLTWEQPSPNVTSLVLGWLNAKSIVPEVDPGDVNSDEARRASQDLRAFRRKLAIKRDPLAHVISIGYTSSDPEEAAKIANRLAEVYLEDRITAKRQAMTETAEHLHRSLEEMRDSLKTAEGEIQKYRATSDLYAVTASSPAEQRYIRLSEELTDASLELTNAKVRLSQADRVVRAGRAIESIREVQASPVINDLRQQEAEVQRRIADLRSQYGPNHPVMQNAQFELDGVRGAIKSQIARIIEHLQLEVTLAENRYKSIQEQLPQAQANLSRSEEARLHLRELERNVDGPRRVFESMLDRFQRAREQEKILLDTARIISPASVPDLPSNFSGTLLVGFTLAGSCLASIGVAFLIEWRRPGFADASQIEDELGRPVVAAVPFVQKPRWPWLRRSRWYALEAYGMTEALRSLIQLLVPTDRTNGARMAKVVAITSSFAEEGKTTLSLSLARQASFSGLKVLLVEGDLRRAGLRAELRTVAPTKGLVDVLRGSVAGFRDAVVTETASGLDMLLGFGPADDAFVLTRSLSMRELLAEARGQYDLIIIDCPPIMVVTDTRSLLGFSDEAIFIIRWQTTERAAVRIAIRELERGGTPMAGVVLNQVQLREHVKYGDADRLFYSERHSHYAVDS